MHCTNCAELLADNTKFCGSCGNEVNRDSTNTASQSEPLSTNNTSAEKEPAENSSANGVSAGEVFGYVTAAIIASAFMAWYQLGDFWQTPSEQVEQSNVASTNPPSVDSAESTTATVASSALEFADARGEWYSNTFAAVMGGKDRQLWIRGSLRNISSDTLTNINCVATLDLRFSNGRKAQTTSNNLCSNSPGELDLDTSWTIKASNVAQIENRKTGGRELWQGPSVEAKFMDYEFSRVLMRLNVTANTPFGDRISATVFSGEIPAPNHRAAFTLTQN